MRFVGMLARNPSTLWIGNHLHFSISLFACGVWSADFGEEHVMDLREAGELHRVDEMLAGHAGFFG